MVNPAGESNDGALRPDFDRRLCFSFADRWLPPTQACSHTGNWTTRWASARWRVMRSPTHALARMGDMLWSGCCGNLGNLPDMKM
jgi:hypothetical protein